MLFWGVSFSQTTDLGPGDIAILQYNTSPTAGAEVIQFIATTSMEAGTVINFTDNGWSGSALNTNEGTTVWTAPSNVKAGDVFSLTLNAANFDFNSDGDQLIAYQGSAGNETFLFAIQGKTTGAWDGDAGSTNNSVLPSGLTTGTNAIILTTVTTGKPSNRKLDFKYNTTSFSGTATAIVTDVATLGNWIGANNSPQTFSGTFTSETTWNGTSWNLTPTISYFNAIINGTYDTSTDGNLTANELTVNASQTLTVNSGGNVTVVNSITNNGSIVVEDNGSFVQERKDGPNTGTNYTVERTSTSQQEERDYTYWSSPLSNAPLLNVANAARYYSFTNAQAWSAESNASTMVSGKGYITTGDASISYPNSYTASFSGSPFNNGDYTMALSSTIGHYALLGNPYPSAITAQDFIDNNPAIGTLYFWTHNTADSVGDNTSDDYVSWNLTGSITGCTGCTAPDGNIASGQGFFAEIITTGASATFTNSMRITGSNTLFFKGRTSLTTRDRVWLNLTRENELSQTLIGFFDKATDGIDGKYDGLRLEGGKNISFYSVIDGKHYGIQGKSPLKDRETISLGFTSTVAGNFTIGIEKFEGNLQKAKLILHDKVLKKKHNLKKSSYTFSIGLPGTFNERFELLINPKQLNDNKETDEKVKIFLTKKVIHITSKEKIDQVKILNLYGHVLYNKKAKGNHIKVTLNKLKNTNMYIVKLLLQSGKIITKKIIE